MMLGKTAGGLYWMFRYLERAENTARLLEAGWRMALTKSDAGENEWESILSTTGSAASYTAKFENVEPAQVIDFLLRDKDNPSSVLSTIEAARSNARMVRTALSSEVWEATNECWMAVKKVLARPVSQRNLYDTLTAIRFRASVVRGALHGTMLRNDIFAFSRLGTFLERADNTARILDVKYYVLLPSAADVGSDIDNVQWEVILRSVSADTAYRWLNGGELTPTGIAEFLMLDDRMPRSLIFCYTNINRQLDRLAKEYGTRHPSHELAHKICDRLNNAVIEQVVDDGLHEFLQSSIADTAQLAGTIQSDFRFFE